MSTQHQPSTQKNSVAREKTRKKKTAIALQYNGESVPYITAVGNDATADDILQLAEHHQIPIQDNLAITKHLDDLSLEDSLPDQVFLTLAQTIAFIEHLEKNF